MTKEIFPQWVLVNDELHRVSEFSHLPPSSRPEAICPICMNPIIMKLGNIKIHHYAHQPEIECSATQPETALHLNTKYYIYHQLLSGNILFLEQQCANDCGEKRNLPWIENWAKVNLEKGISSFRPDITVISRNGDIKAIEVVVTHHIEEEKENYFKANNIGWLEVEASESLYMGENVWKIDQPLPYTICKPQLMKWTCSKCLKRLRQQEELERRQEIREEYKEHNYSQTIFGKLVDFYYPSGKKYRETYYIQEVIRNDNPTGILVLTPKGIIKMLEGKITDDLIKSAFDEIKPDIERRLNLGAIVDEREWSRWVPGEKFFARDTWRYPFRYEWDNTIKGWVKVKQKELDAWNARIRESPYSGNIQKPEAVCVYCKEKTTDYCIFNGLTRDCVCNKCHQAGKH